MAKRDTQFLFEVHINRISKKSGLLHVKGSEEMINVMIEEGTDADKRNWCPEELFLSSVCSSYMKTFIEYSEKIGFEISGFECNVIGHAGFEDGKLLFTQIDIYPQVFIAFEGLREKANHADTETRKHCMICNSINARIIYHTQLFVGSDDNEAMPSTHRKESII
ncbi:MAG: OsmC family protein [Bacteroidetes bacterium]|nr:OsmC family protein [Bacteroidota bacterium]